MPFDPYTWLNSIKDQVTRATQAAPESTSRFFSMFLTEAPMKWATMLMTQTPCFVIQHGKRCQAKALSPCLTCGKPTCLDHSLLAADGRLMCHLCVAKAYQLIRKEAGLPADEWTDAPKAESPKKKEMPLRQKHLATLGLEDPTNLAEIKAQFRALSKKWHPDRGKTPEAVERRTKKMKAISEAYHWLAAEEEKKAA